MSTRHSKAAKQFLKNGEKAQWQDSTLWGVRVKRDRMSKSLPEWEHLRDMASAIKRHTVTNLDVYLEQFAENAERNGIIVHWAKDADEFNSTVLSILRSHDVRKLVKSKSMLTEECEMNPYLEKHGIEKPRFLTELPELILLDIMLPGMDGWAVCRKIREKKDIPILMVSAKKDDIDKIRGLGLGADDYMTKPFNTTELKARMKNLLKRSEGSIITSGNEVRVKNLVMDKDKRTVSISGVKYELTAKEFDILLLLVTNPGKVFRREDLLELIWKDYSGDIRTVDVHIRRLRQKIEGDQNQPEYVYTKWGVGYYFAEN